MPDHLKVLTLATMLVVSGQAFALEDSYLPANKIPYVAEAPDQPQRLGPLWGERAKGPAGTLLTIARWS
jgi:DNA-binding GntR family transcriptional regulator